GDALGFAQPATVYVEYSNTGSVPMPGPLLLLKAVQGVTAAAFLTLDPTRVVSGVWNQAVPDGFSTSVQFLASGATPGVLAPGETIQVPVYWAGWLASLWNPNTPVVFNLGVLQPDDTTPVDQAGLRGAQVQGGGPPGHSPATTPVDWAGLRDSLRPQGINADAWNALYPSLTARLGSTWGAYLSRLDADAQYLAGLGKNGSGL